ncbi:hypothetical protein [Ekhidna sp. To15]|uniref:hypothetical protein n=1 Tax=Ekhidna sp. To15 TaxID=3395267 RepID=UPI003F51E0C6
MKNVLTLICITIGSFLVWLVTRRRSLKEEMAIYDYDSHFWTSFSVGAIFLVTVGYIVFEILPW